MSAQASTAITDRLFERAFLDASIGMALVGLDGRWLRVNDPLCAMLGYEAGRLLQLDVQSLTHPGDLGSDLDLLREALAGKRHHYRLRKRYVRGDGSILHALLDASLVRDAGGAPQFFIAQVQDTSEHVRATAERDAFFALAPDLLAIVDGDDRLTEVNPAWDTTLGWAAHEIDGRPLADLVHVDDRERGAAFLADVRAGRGDAGLRSRLRSRHGGYRWLEWTAHALDGGRLYCSARDVTDQVRARDAMLRHRDELEQRIAERTAELDRALARLTLHADNSPLATIEWDSRLRVTHWSRRARVLFGWREDEVLGRGPGQWPFMHPDDAAALTAAMGALCRRERSRNVHVARVLARDGRVLDCEWFDSALFDADGEVSSILSLVQDVSERHAAERALRQAHEDLEAKVAERTAELERLMAVLESQARQDPLTGLPNRRGLMERLPRSIRRSGRQHGAAVVMFVDLDRFKQVNDRLGHEAGDALLRECARRLVASVRTTDIVARLGGDEFVVVLENVREPDIHATRVAEKIRAALAVPFDWAGTPVAISASIGVVVRVDDTGAPDELIARADRGMYAAKHGGGNAVRIEDAGADREPADQAAVASR